MESTHDLSVTILVLGLTIGLAMLIKAFFSRGILPTLVGYIGLGLGLRLVEQGWGAPYPESRDIFLFLGDAGLVALLFRVGLESNLRRLRSQIGRASLVAVGDICLAGIVAYGACRWLLSLDLTQSVIVASALTATSVGVTVSVWQAAGSLNTRTGALLVDVAEMDDIAGVIILGLVLALASDLRTGHVRLEAFETVLGLTLARLALFTAVCFAFARYLERPLMAFLRHWEVPADLNLTMTALGFILAALAGLLGFSLAIGAFFAGLAFSRDPRALPLDRGFTPIYELLSPFFFIGIGLRIDPASLPMAGLASLVLLLAALLGKLLGNGLPVWFLENRRAALLVGVSMAPRAEVTMIIMQMGQGLGDWAVPDAIFAAVVLSSVLTCIVGAVLVKVMLDKLSPGQN
ncbi:cation:proton antiporter [Desulfocurvibacter africanus]|uniref:Sodium/hydrogen exchanger n=1 Tax=Desulfocurvibacter africanus subsp. africanus str. Walvis Bay TaxID=690850 RepID=F3Z2E0_DESAF|nr:cation:proton antiporter [Desulfocurvibacter africanus]EGJ50180.1 sodium/hydrogen exchanger [Desulfocurvibacter africanus subsp. africanus str. Walvis Bay]